MRKKEAICAVGRHFRYAHCLPKPAYFIMNGVELTDAGMKEVLDNFLTIEEILGVDERYPQTVEEAQKSAEVDFMVWRQDILKWVASVREKRTVWSRMKGWMGLPGPVGGAIDRLEQSILALRFENILKVEWLPNTLDIPPLSLLRIGTDVFIVKALYIEEGVTIDRRKISRLQFWRADGTLVYGLDDGNFIIVDGGGELTLNVVGNTPYLSLDKAQEAAEAIARQVTDDMAEWLTDSVVETP